MYSNQYRYYEIHGDNYSQKMEYRKIVKIILDQNCFVQKDNQIFKNKDDFPWISIGIVYTQNDNYATKNEKKEINLITIVTQKNIDQSIYTNVLLNIAKELNWKLFLEEDDEGNENIEILKK